MLSLNINLVFEIINVIVLYLLLKHFLLKPVMAIIDKRQTMIEQSIGNARDSEAKAEELKNQYEQKLLSSKEEGAKIVEQAKQDAKAQYQRIVTEADTKAGQIVDSAHKTASADQEKAMREAETQIANLVIAAAAKVVNQEAGELNNQALYNKYIAEAGDAHDAGSL